jgi:LAS superfamily LD-carboxypeptidase LdcB
MKKLTDLYNLIKESQITEAYPVVSDTFPNVSFSDRVVGSSTPNKDRVNPILLQDIEKAAAMANVKIDVTTIVSGHRKGTRHERGQAVDIARFYNDNGKPVGYSGERSAKKNGIYDKIMAFVSALESLGYKKNVGESGNPKVVLTFGFKNHHHHVHVSNTNTDPSQQVTSPVQTPIQTSVADTNVELPIPDEDETVIDGKTGENRFDIFGGKLNPLIDKFKSMFSQFGMAPIVQGVTQNKELTNVNLPQYDKKNVNNLLNKKVVSNSKFSELPDSINSAISKLEKNYNIDITDEHIRKEFEQEGNYREDAGKENIQARQQINKLINDAKRKFPKLGKLGIVSGYRSYDDQVMNFGKKSKTRGIDNTQKANTIPGFSQHHTGKAFDIFSVETSWWNKNSDVKEWVSKNAPKYGFDVTYKSQGPLRIAEPWHLYYVGGEVNEQIVIHKKIVKEEIERIKQLMK